jgi:transposase-like protein
VTGNSRRRWTAEEKLQMVDGSARRAARSPEDRSDAAGLPRVTNYRWQEWAAEGRLADRVVVPHRQATLPTPEQVAIVV